MRALILAVITLLLSLNVMADPRVGDPMPSLVQYLYIQGDGDYSFSDEQKKGISESLIPFFDHKWLDEEDGVSTPAGSVFNNNVGLVVVGHGKQSSALKVLRYVKGVSAVVAIDVISGRGVPGAQAFTIDDVINNQIEAKTAEQQTMLLVALRSAAFKARIKSMTTEQRENAAMNLYAAAAGPLNAMNMLEQEMMVAARSLILAKNKNSSYNDLEKEARLLLEEKSEIKYARQDLRKTLREITEIAYSLRGRTHNTEFFFAGLGHPNSALADMAEKMPKAAFMKKLDAYFKLVEQGVLSQMNLAHERLRLEYKALEEHRKTPYAFSNIMEKSPVKMGGRGHYGNNMGAVFQDERNWDAYSYQLFHDEAKWRVLLEYLNSPDKDIADLVSNRILKLFNDVEIPMSQMMEKMDQNEIMSRAYEDARMFHQSIKNKSFDELLADRVVDLQQQTNRVNYIGIYALTGAIQGLLFSATWQVYVPTEQAAALGAERAIKMLIKIKALVRTKRMKEYFARLGEDMIGERQSSIVRLDAIKPGIAKLAAEFAGVKQELWPRQRGRALVVCDQFIAKK